MNWLLDCATVLIFGWLYCWMAWGLVWSAGLSLVAGWYARALALNLRVAVLSSAGSCFILAVVAAKL